MKKQIKLLIESLFDDIYDDSNDLSTDIVDSQIIESIINKLKSLKYNKTPDYNIGNINDLEKVTLFIDKFFNFIINTKSFYKSLAYKIEETNDSYKCTIANEQYMDGYPYLIFYINKDDISIIEKLDIFVTMFCYTNGKVFHAQLVELLNILTQENITINKIIYNYQNTELKIKKLQFEKFTYDGKYKLTSSMIDKIPEIYFDNKNIYSFSNLKIYINNIVVDSEETYKKFLQYLKNKKIKKFDSSSYMTIIDEEENYIYSNEILRDFCIDNKIELYSFTTDKPKIENLIEDETVRYCKKHYDCDFERYAWSIEFKDKIKDKNGSGAQILVEIEFDDNNNKHKYLKILWDFYKTGFIQLNNVKDLDKLLQNFKF